MLSAAISVQALLLILLIVVLVFGTKKLGNIGADLGNALRSFRKAVRDESAAEDADISAGDKNLNDKSGHNK
ncbi:MAG TPA: twin-arginine translocase TatA/TatE family subunit [Gammaproteobacteria bacterium]